MKGKKSDCMSGLKEKGFADFLWAFAKTDRQYRQERTVIIFCISKLEHDFNSVFNLNVV